MSTPPIEIIPFEATSYAEVHKQRQIDEKAFGRYRGIGSPIQTIYNYDDDGKFTGCDYRVHVYSPLAWSIPCPVKKCGAKVDQRCNMASGDTHVKRIQAYRKVAPVIPFVDRPTWWKRLRLRVEQRRIIVQVEVAARNQSRANSQVNDAREEARMFGVEEAMIRRAVDHGHKAVMKEEKGYRAKREVWRADRLKRALE